MAKITLNSILSGFNLSKINDNFQKIQDELNNKVLYRDNPVGEPNTPTGDIDMNGKNILNIGTLGVSTSFSVNGLDLATQVNNAANSAASALTYSNNALSYKNTTFTYLDSFKKQYQGALSSAPTVRYDGTALQTGDLYFNTTLNAMQVYGGSGWAAAGSSVNGTSRRQVYTYTSGTPSFAVTGGYDSGYVDVYVNGFKLIRTTDFDDSSGTNIVINGTLASGDVVDVVAYGTFNIANVYTKTESDAYRTAIYARIGDLSSINFRNRIINGDMRIDQRNNGAAVTINSATQAFIMDRFMGRGTASAGTFTVQQVSDAPVGFQKSAKITITTASASPAAGDLYYFQQRIEGFNIADLGMGTANAQQFSASFWIKASIAGTYTLLASNNVDAHCAKTFTISSANTWEYKTVVFPACTTGTWAVDNSLGLLLSVCVGAGSTYTGSGGSWGSAFINRDTTAINLISTLNATLQITGVQMESGTTVTPFERRPYGAEFAMCQRYYQAYTSIFVSGYNGAGSNVFTDISLPVVMRANPTVTLSGWSNLNGSNASVNSNLAHRVRLQTTATATGYAYSACDATIAAEL